MEPGIATAIVTASAAIMVSVIGGLYTWLSARKKSNIDADGQVVTNFSILVNQIQEERGEQRQTVQRLLSEITVMRAESEKCNTRVLNLERKNTELDDYVSRLEKVLLQYGMNSKEPGP